MFAFLSFVCGSSFDACAMLLFSLIFPFRFFSAIVMLRVSFLDPMQMFAFLSFVCGCWMDDVYLPRVVFVGSRVDSAARVLAKTLAAATHTRFFVAFWIILPSKCTIRLPLLLWMQ